MQLTYEQVNDLLHAYAIDALEPDEMAAVDDYFHMQQKLVDRLADVEAATTLLAQNSTPVAVNADTKKTIMGRIHAELATEALPASNSSFGAGSAIGNSPASDDFTGASFTGGESGKENQTDEQTQAVPNLDNRAQKPAEERVPEQTPGQAKPVTHYNDVFEYTGTNQPPIPLTKNRHRPKRETSRSIFPRAFVNAALAASMAGLLFLGLLNYRSQQAYNALAAESSETKSRLVEAEAQIQESNQTMVALSSENDSLDAQNQELAAQQAQLSSENEELTIQLAAVEAEQKAQNVRNLILFAAKSQVESQLAKAESQLAEYTDRLVVVGAASQATVMFGTEEAPGLQGTFFHASQEGELVIHGLKPLPAEQIYQFWLVSESGEQVSAGTFGIDADQEPTWVNLDLPQNLPSYSLAGISIEPASGSSVPTGPMLLESSLELDESA